FSPSHALHAPEQRYNPLLLQISESRFQYHRSGYRIRPSLFRDTKILWSLLRGIIFEGRLHQQGKYMRYRYENLGERLHNLLRLYRHLSKHTHWEIREQPLRSRRYTMRQENRYIL